MYLPITGNCSFWSFTKHIKKRDVLKTAIKLNAVDWYFTGLSLKFNGAPILSNLIRSPTHVVLAVCAARLQFIRTFYHLIGKTCLRKRAMLYLFIFNFFFFMYIIRITGVRTFLNTKTIGPKRSCSEFPNEWEIGGEEFSFSPFHYNRIERTRTFLCTQ